MSSQVIGCSRCIPIHQRSVLRPCSVVHTAHHRMSACPRAEAPRREVACSDLANLIETINSQQSSSSAPVEVAPTAPTGSGQPFSNTSTASQATTAGPGNSAQVGWHGQKLQPRLDLSCMTPRTCGTAVCPSHQPSTFPVVVRSQKSASPSLAVQV